MAKSLLKTLTIIHIGLVSGLVIFTVFAVFTTNAFIAQTADQSVWIYVTPIVAATAYFMSQFIFRKNLEAINRQTGLDEKLKTYMTASIVKYAILEGAGLLAIVAYFLSGNALHLTLAIALIAYLLVQRPTTGKVLKDLPLTRSEEQELNS